MELALAALRILVERAHRVLDETGSALRKLRLDTRKLRYYAMIPSLRSQLDRAHSRKYNAWTRASLEWNPQVTSVGISNRLMDALGSASRDLSNVRRIAQSRE